MAVNSSEQVPGQQTSESSVNDDGKSLRADTSKESDNGGLGNEDSAD